MLIFDFQVEETPSMNSICSDMPLCVKMIANLAKLRAHECAAAVQGATLHG